MKVGIYRSRLADIPQQVMDREVHVGFVKEKPGFHELKCVDVHTDEMVLVASPSHPLATTAGDAALVMPDGPTGAVFLGYDNYRAILKWNNSSYFAIAVGSLADDFEDR